MTVIEVGAHRGDDTRRFLGSGATVHAFEPAPQLAQRLRDIGDERIIVNEMAVSDYDGRATFYLNDGGDFGCGSLFQFAEGLDRTWPGRSDLKSSSKVRVKVTRLDTYMLKHHIEDVDYLHIDAQGADLAVLRGLGELFTRVRAGKVEAATSRERALYKGQPLADDIERWFDAYDFRITERENNDQWGNEVNLSFARK